MVRSSSASRPMSGLWSAYVSLTGSVYTGSFVRGKEEGKGVLIEKDGTRFEGFFKQGKKDGPFVEMDANGNIVRKGTFRYGRLLEEKK